MAKLGKGSVLKVLNRTRLQELIDRFDLDRPSRAKKDDLVNILTRSRRASLEDLIGTLRRDELKAICRAHDLDDTGRAKRDLIDRILNQWIDARRCRACKTLGDFKSIESLRGSLRKKVDSFLVVALTETSSSEVSEVWQCPACKTHYQYQNDWVQMSRTYKQYDSGRGKTLPSKQTKSLKKISAQQAKEIIDRQKSPLPRKTISWWRGARKPRNVPDRLKVNLTWNERRGKGWMSVDGVDTGAGNLLWYTHCHPGWAGGGAKRQSFQSFPRKGPEMGDVPPKILLKLRAVVEEIVETYC